MKNFLSSKAFTLGVSLLGLYLISAGTSWALFSFLGVGGESEFVSEDIGENRSRIDPNLPKTEECPINGKYFSKPEKAIWEERRPITAVIENHEESRPQSGLSKADVVYEAVAEGGITRFLTVFYCGASAEDVKIAPVRSARVYFINWASAYGEKPIFVHVGGANNICNNCPGGVKPRGQTDPRVDAFALMTKLGWRSAKGNDFDGGTNVGVPIIIRDQYRLGEKSAWEHSVVGSTDKIFDEALSRGFGYEEGGEPWNANFDAWKFADDAPVSTPDATKISFEFWSNKPDYDVIWEYDTGTNSYKRLNGGSAHTDHETKEQISAKNVVIIFVEEEGPVDQEGHMYYETLGSGEALFFQNGEVIEGKWSKKTRESMLTFTNKSGSEVSLVRGETWVEAVPEGSDVEY